MKNMSSAQEILLSLLRKSMFGIDINIPDDVDWKEVYDEAVFQMVAPIAFDGTAGIDNIPPAVLSAFEKYSVSVIFRNENMLLAQDDLTNLLEDNNINYAVFKGYAVSRYYTNPALRVLGDIDFLVNEKDFAFAEKILLENGFVLEKTEDKMFHNSYFKNSIEYEMHFELSEFPDEEIATGLRESLGDAVSYSVSVSQNDHNFKTLSDLYFAVSLLLHMERHIRHDGLGLRQLMDWGMFSYKTDFMNNENYTDYLKKYGLYNLAIIADDLFKKYFLGEEIDNPVADELMILSFEKGNFGVKRAEEETYASKILCEDHGIKSFFPIKWYLFFYQRAAFTWKISNKYPFLKCFAIIYIPIRYLFRRIFNKADYIDIKKIMNLSEEIDIVYNKLEIFKEGK